MKLKKVSKKDRSLPGGKRRKQLSNKAIQEKVRPYAPEAIQVLVKEMHQGDNSNARIGAAKVILAKVLPDLKSQEFDGEMRMKIMHVIGLPTENNLDSSSRSSNGSLKAG